MLGKQTKCTFSRRTCLVIIYLLLKNELVDKLAVFCCCVELLLFILFVFVVIGSELDELFDVTDVSIVYSKLTAVADAGKLARYV